MDKDNISTKMIDTLFVPKINEFVKLMIKYDFKTYDSPIEKSIAKAIQLHFDEYINHHFSIEFGTEELNTRLLPIKDMYNCAEKANRILKNYYIYMAPSGFFSPNHRPYYGKDLFDVFIKNSNHADVDIVGSGIILKEFDDFDNDCYATPGGYRQYKTSIGTKFNIEISNNNKLMFVYDTSLIVDHYNNNICGNPTGGGTTKYDIGKNLHKRCKFFELDNLEPSIGMFQIEELDINKASTIALNNIHKIIYNKVEQCV